MVMLNRLKELVMNCSNSYFFNTDTSGLNMMNLTRMKQILKKFCFMYNKILCILRINVDIIFGNDS